MKMKALQNLIERLDGTLKICYSISTSYTKETNGGHLEHYFTNSTDLRSELRSISFENNGDVFTFWSDLGVFSKSKIDYGSKALVATILKEEKEVSSILDVGCGYGFLGIVLSKKYHCPFLGVDINKRAVHLCLRNIKENKVDGQVLESNCYDKVTGQYDLIVTNPPIRAGKKVVLAILKDAIHYMNQDSRLWFVIRKDQGAKSIQKELETTYQCEIIKKDKGFYIMRAKIY